MSGAIARLTQRRDVLMAAMVMLLGLAGPGPLPWAWALAGAAALALWSALWPLPSASQSSGKGAGIARRQLGRRSEATRAIVEGIPDAALLLAPDTRVVVANAVAHALAPVQTGLPLSHWSRSPELLSAIDRALDSGTRQRFTMRWFTPVDRTLDALVTPIPGIDTNEQPTLLVTIRDLTEQEQMTRMRADFVANASHELRTPLASIKGFIETLQGAAKDDPAARDRFLAIMEEQATRMTRLIADLLSLSRIEMREHLAPGDSVDLSGVAIEVSKALEPAAALANIELRVSGVKDAMPVTGDRDELVQVVHNLAQNALKYGRKGGYVEISVRQAEGRVALTVEDDGIGIAAEHLPRLTERFYRVSPKQSRERGGTGLGLAIVKHIVNRHRGELAIESTLGQGSRFTVTLPGRPLQTNDASREA